MQATKISPWVFTVTAAIARRTENYGDRYTGIATLNFIEETCFISGLLVNGEPLKKKELLPFLRYAKLMNCKEIHYSRIHNGKTRNEVYNV